MEETDPWREYRKRRNLSLVALLGFVPFVFLLIQLPGRPFGTLVFVAAIAWMIFALIAGNWFIRFKCPCCKEPFFADSRWWGYNTFTRHCLHCKLPLNARFSTPEQRREEERRLRAQYGGMFDSIAALLFRHDPIGICCANNTDEYYPEARTILPRLRDCGSAEEALRMVHAEFVRWFTPKIAGPKERYAEIASEIWDLWQENER